MIQPGHSVAAMVRSFVASIFIQQPSDQREHSAVAAGPGGRSGLEEHRRLDWRPNAPPNNRPPRVIPFILESDSMKNLARKLRVGSHRSRTYKRCAAHSRRQLAHN